MQPVHSVAPVLTPVVRVTEPPPSPLGAFLVAFDHGEVAEQPTAEASVSWIMTPALPMPMVKETVAAQAGTTGDISEAAADAPVTPFTPDTSVETAVDPGLAAVITPVVLEPAVSVPAPVPNAGIGPSAPAVSADVDAAQSDVAVDRSPSGQGLAAQSVVVPEVAEVTTDSTTVVADHVSTSVEPAAQSNRRTERPLKPLVDAGPAETGALPMAKNPELALAEPAATPSTEMGKPVVMHDPMIQHGPINLQAALGQADTFAPQDMGLGLGNTPVRADPVAAAIIAAEKDTSNATLATDGRHDPILEQPAGNQNLEKPAALGFWERVFSALVLPVVGTVETNTQPGSDMALPALAIPVKTPHPDPIVIASRMAEDDATTQNHQDVVAHSALQGVSTDIKPGPLPVDLSASLPAVAALSDPAAWLSMASDLRDDLAEERLASIFASTGNSVATYASGSATPAQSASAPPVAHVAAQITAALSRSADGATELALSPEELGHVRLRLEPDSANPDRMVVMITFERADTLDLFRRHAGELAEALRSAGYAGADIGFGQGDGESSGFDDAPRHGVDPDQPDRAPPIPPAPRLAAGASLDLRL